MAKTKIRTTTFAYTLHLTLPEGGEFDNDRIADAVARAIPGSVANEHKDVGVRVVYDGFYDKQNGGTILDVHGFFMAPSVRKPCGADSVDAS